MMICSHNSDADTSDDCDSDSSQNAAVVEYCTPVPENYFTNPESAARSGGTAAFFHVKYIGPPGPPAQKYGKSVEYWIAKDLAHAMDELSFYEKMITLGPEYSLLRKWAFDYGGVLTAKCIMDQNTKDLEPNPRQLLLLKNLRDDHVTCRMLDIKIGRMTAVAGWQGKSLHAAHRNRFVDHVTNSAKQGFRLEGFDNPPTELSTQLEGEPGGLPCFRYGKKTRRFNLQRLIAPVFLRHWIDFGDLQKHSEIQGESVLLPIEYSEYLLFDMIKQLASLCVDAQHMPVPQMWIGSSLALVCESGTLPNRQSALQALASGSTTNIARLNVFDWGRCELNTIQHHRTLSTEECKKRETFWSLWLHGCLRLLFDAVVLYCNQFSMNLNPDCTVEFKIWDYDTHDSNDFIGVVTLPLAPTHGPVTLSINHSQCPLFARSAKIEVEITAGQIPSKGSRLSQMWHVTVHSVSNLPDMDIFSRTDPIVEVRIRSNDPNFTPKANTPVIYNDNNAVFHVQLDFGQSRPEVLNALFDVLSNAFGEEVDASFFPRHRGHKARSKFNEFLSRIEKFEHLAEKC